ncbi:hypothetical protein J4209_00655 [Candidatus Woesearchaeota archaeon]|nr:hypothetical protein [Candidatus Woesearchaeota archaeon]
MKLLFEYEDCVIGIITGILVIGSANVIKIPYNRGLLMVFLPLFFFFSIFDIIHLFKDAESHILIMFLGVLHDLIDMGLVLFLTANLFGIKLGLPLVGMLDEKTMLVGVGIFFIVANALWFFELFKGG